MTIQLLRDRASILYSPTIGTRGNLVKHFATHIVDSWLAACYLLIFEDICQRGSLKIHAFIFGASNDHQVNFHLRLIPL